MNRVLEFVIQAKDKISAVMERVAKKFAEAKEAAYKMAEAVADAGKRGLAALGNIRDYAAEADKKIRALGGGYTSTLQMEAELAKKAKETAAAKADEVAKIREQAGATSDLANVLRRCGVDMDGIKKREEDEKQRRIALIALNRELKKAQAEASAATGHAAEAAQGRVKMLQAGIAQMSKDGLNDVNLMEAGFAALHGNFESLAKGAVNAAKAMGILKWSVASVSVVLIAITAVVEMFRMFATAIDEAKQKMHDLEMRQFQKDLDAVADTLKRINEETARGNKLFDEETARTKAVMEAKKKQALAENELARARALEGKDDAGAASVNQQFDEQANAIEKRFAQQLKAYSDQRADTQLQILENDLEKVTGLWREANQRFKEAEEAYNNEAWKEDEYSDKELADDSYYQQAKKKYDAAKAQEEELANKKLELEDAVRKAAFDKQAGLNEQLAAADLKEQELKDEKLRIQREANAKNQRIKEEENAKELEGVWMDWYNAYADYQKNKDSEVAKEKCQLLQEYYDLLAQCTDDAQRAQLKADFDEMTAKLQFLKQFEDEERAAREKRKADELAAQKQIHEQKVADATAELEASKEQLSAAQERASAAQQAVSQAWGWYKDKDSLKAQIASEEGDLAAQKQYQKDYRSLIHGRNASKYSEALELQRLGHTDKLEAQMAQWRKGPFGLSVEDEATMRVALAKDAEKDANRDLNRVAENTENLAEILAILKGGEESA